MRTPHFPACDRSLLPQWFRVFHRGGKLSVINPNEAANTTKFIHIYNQESVMFHTALILMKNKHINYLSSIKLPGLLSASKPNTTGIIKIHAYLMSCVR